MSIFTFLLDAAVQNAFGLLLNLIESIPKLPCSRQFKKRIAEQFVLSGLNKTAISISLTSIPQH